MRKLVIVLTALTFALGLTASGYTQTTAKQGDKPAVQTQTPGAGSQVTPVEKDKGKEAVKPVTKEAEPVKGKGSEKQMMKKDTGKKPAAPTAETKKEEKKEVTK